MKSNINMDLLTLVRFEERDTPPQERLVYLALLVNKHVHESGFYEIGIKALKRLTGLTDEELTIALENLEQAGFIVYDRPWLYIEQVRTAFHWLMFHGRESQAHELVRRHSIVLNDNRAWQSWVRFTSIMLGDDMPKIGARPAVKIFFQPFQDVEDRPDDAETTKSHDVLSAASLLPMQRVTTPSLPHRQGVTTPSLPDKQGVSTPSLPDKQGVSTPSLPDKQGVSTPSLPDKQGVSTPSLPDKQGVSTPSVPPADTLPTPSIPPADTVAIPYQYPDDPVNTFQKALIPPTYGVSTGYVPPPKTNTTLLSVEREEGVRGGRENNDDEPNHSTDEDTLP